MNSERLNGVVVLAVLGKASGWRITPAGDTPVDRLSFSLIEPSVEFVPMAMTTENLRGLPNSVVKNDGECRWDGFVPPSTMFANPESLSKTVK